MDEHWPGAVVHWSYLTRQVVCKGEHGPDTWYAARARNWASKIPQGAAADTWAQY